RVPVANRLGAEGDGFAMLTSNLAQERVSLPLNSLAAAQSTLDHTVRALADSAPGQHVKFELAACRTEIEAGQALIDRALEAHMTGDLSVQDAAVAKLYATELHGRVSRIYGGSSEIMKVIISQSFDFTPANRT